MISTRQAYGDALAELGGTNPNIVVLDADLSGSTKTKSFAVKYPERFINCGIAEAQMVCTAAGLAASGKIAFASTFAMFAAGRAYEQIRNSVAYPRLNVKIAATHTGITVGEDGASHQCIEDIALMRVIPGMTVICPSDGIETAAATRAAAEMNGPVYLRLGRADLPIINDATYYKFIIGKAVTLKEGNDVAIIATGIGTIIALDAAKLLAEKGIYARVINMHTIKPLDEAAVIAAAKECKGIITVEEHNIIGGLGSAVCEVVAENGFGKAVKRIGVYDVFGTSGKAFELLEKYGISDVEIVKAAEEMIGV
jgi:transketolase